MSFVHLHTHTHYSILTGLGSPEALLDRAKELEMSTIAITDLGSMYGVVEFYKYAKSIGIKPIIGVELAVAPLGRENKTAENKTETLVLLAKNFKGYQNLMQLCTLAALEGFYYRPRVDYELLKQYHEGLIALSGNLSGGIARAILEQQDAKARDLIQFFQEIYGREHFFLEMQSHPEIANWSIVNQKLMELSREMNAPLVASNDTYYLKPNDAEAQDVLLCIRLQKNLQDKHRLQFQGDYSLRSSEEMKEAFSFCKEAVENTAKIAEMCELKLNFGEHKMPEFPTDGEDPEEYLKKLCFSGLKKRYGEENQEALKRLDFELSVISTMGFATYFLIVHDLVAYAKSQGIVVGPGRGSAAGSIIAYCLEITELDPLKYGLLFERFLNPERISMPDIDIDFTDLRRDEVLNYVTQKYGEDHVAQIITFGTLAAKAAVRDVGRTLGYSYSEVDRIAKAIPAPVLGKHAPLSESIQEDPELSRLYQSEAPVKEILDMAIKLEGTVRQVGTHACAVIISKDPLVEDTPLQRATGEKEGMITQYSMKPCEDLGLLKMDFLGLKNLSIIETTLGILKRTQPDLVLNLSELPMDDQKTFELLQRGETTGVFQLESSGMKRYLKDLCPTEFGDIIAMVSLYRPGPMQFISDYINGKHGKKKITYVHESLQDILKETYGIAIYQEQILQIAQKFSGFTLGQADLLRRAIGKKIASELVAQREKFISGAESQGYSFDLAVKIFDEVIEPFAGYGFNKSHAACYALIAYQTAYLKAHFPAEFMAALLTADSGDTDRVVIEIQECRHQGIEVLPPHVNESRSHFTVITPNQIRFGLSAIKGIGEAAVHELIHARNTEGPFKNLADFCERVPSKILNKKSIEALAYAGALDGFGERAELAYSFEAISEYSKNQQKSKLDGQMDLFGLGLSDDSHQIQIAKVSPLSQWDRLKKEKEVLGLYVSGHPLAGFEAKLKSKGKLIETYLGENKEKYIGKKIKVTGLISKLKRVMTKTGQYMAYGELEDSSSQIDFVIFPKSYEHCGVKIQEDKLIQFEGRLNKRDERVQLMVDQAQVLSFDKISEKSNAETSSAGIDFTLTLEPNAKDDLLPKIKALLEQNKGTHTAELRINTSPQQIMRVPFGISDEPLFLTQLEKFVAISRLNH